MKKKTLLFFPILFAVGIGLFSCIGNNGNVGNYQNIPAVVTFDYNTGGIMLGTNEFGYIAASELTDVMPGDCIFLDQFTVDYDNQPSTQYLTMTNVMKHIVGQSPLEMRSDTVDATGYTLPLTGVSVFSSPYYQGKIFIRQACNDADPTFRLVYNSQDTIINGAMNLYLMAQSSSSVADPSAKGYTMYYAFDLSDLIQSAGQDTTVTVSGYSDIIDLKYIKVNLNYVSSVSDTGKPTYSGISQNPFSIIVFQ